MLVTPKKNILHYSNDLGYGEGGHITQSLTLLSSAVNKEYCIDSGINWTKVYFTYGGIEMVVKTFSSLGHSEANFIAGTIGVPPEDAYSVDPVYVHDWGTFLYGAPSENYNNGAFTFATRVNRDILGPRVSSTVITASLQLYRNPEEGGEGYYKKLILEDSSQGGSELGRIERGPNLNCEPQLIEDRYCNLCIFTDYAAYIKNLNRRSMKNLGYAGWDIYGFDGTTRTPLFQGVPWVDSSGRGCIKDLVSDRLFYNLGPKNPLPDILPYQ